MNCDNCQRSTYAYKNKIILKEPLILIFNVQFDKLKKESDGNLRVSLENQSETVVYRQLLEKEYINKDFSLYFTKFQT